MLDQMEVFGGIVPGSNLNIMAPRQVICLYNLKGTIVGFTWCIQSLLPMWYLCGDTTHLNVPAGCFYQPYEQACKTGLYLWYAFSLAPKRLDRQVTDRLCHITILLLPISLICFVRILLKSYFYVGNTVMPCWWWMYIYQSEKQQELWLWKPRVISSCRQMNIFLSRTSPLTLAKGFALTKPLKR